MNNFDRFLVQPFDVLKIRYQLQVEKKALAKYKSLGGMVTTISTEEGLTAFWKGHMTAQYLSVIYMAIQFGLNEVFTRQMFEIFPSLKKSDSDTKMLALARSACGAPAAVCATLASYPFDVMRTRKIAQLSSPDMRKSKMYYSTTIALARCIWTVEGPRAFYKGLTPQLVSMVPYSALAFGFYEFLTQTCYRANLNTFTSSEDGQKYLGFYSKCMCSAFSGVLAKSLTYPLDTVRKRLQVQGFEQGRIGMGETPKYSGMKDCFAKIFQVEGFRGFFKGIVPGNLKAAISTLLYFQLYEIFKKKISQLRQKQ